MQSDPEKSLGDDATFAGRVKPPAASRDVSIGDERTLGDGLSGQETILDDIEVVDLEARYRVEGTLGQGGMGAVLLATDTRLDRKVAIKRILGEAAGNRMAVNRFLTEAKSIAALNHPNVVQIYDYGRANDGPFLIMEYVDGGSLLDRCRDGAIPLESAVDLACQLCDGLAKAHDLGIIHRDIKPANVLLTKDGTPKLTDFGLAKAQAGDYGQTMTGAVLGTPDFMPPEQRRDASLVDHRSDLWSLAATIYQMVTGRSPKIIRFKDVPELTKLVLVKALEDAKEDRYQTVREFRDALKASLQTVMAAVPSHDGGHCPACGVENDPSRRFCRGCGSSLEAACFSCGRPLPLREEICGECGCRQGPLIEERRAAMATQRAKAEGLLGDNEFEKASQVAIALRDEPDPRLNDLRAWSDAFLAKVEESRKSQTLRAVEELADAQSHEQSYDYLSAIYCLESVPPNLREISLPGASETVACALSRLKQAQADSVRIEKTIAEKLKSRHVSGLLPDVERLIALQPQRADLNKLRQQLIERQSRLDAVRLAAVAKAQNCLSHHDYEGAVASLGQLNQAEDTPETTTLRAQATASLEHVGRLLTTIRSGLANKQYDGLLESVEAYLALKPDDAEANKIRQSLVAHEERLAAKARAAESQAEAAWEACDFHTVATLLGQIPERHQSVVAHSRLESSNSLIAERSLAITTLQSALKSGQYVSGLDRIQSYRTLLDHHDLHDATVAELTARCEQAHAEQLAADALERARQRTRRRLAATAIVGMAIVASLAAGIWLRSEMRADALAAAIASSRWDDALAIDPHSTAALIGRARQKLSSSSSNPDDAFTDLTAAEAIAGNAEGLAVTKALAHGVKARVLATSGQLNAAERELAEAQRLGAETEAVAGVRRMLVAAWLTKAKQAQAEESSVGIKAACAQARRHGATDEEVAELTADAKVIDGRKKMGQEQYGEALALFDAALALAPSRNLDRERGVASLALADQALARAMPEKAALLLRQAVDCGVRNADTGKVAAGIAGQLVDALKASPSTTALKGAVAAYGVGKSEADSAERRADLDGRVVGMIQVLVEAFEKNLDQTTYVIADDAIRGFEANGLPVSRTASARAGMGKATMDRASALMKAGDLQLAASMVATARDYATSARKERKGDRIPFPEESSLIAQLLRQLVQACEQGSGDAFARCMESLAKLELSESDGLTIQKSLTAMPKDAFRFVSPEHVAKLPTTMLPLLPSELISKLSPDELGSLPEDVLDKLPPDIQAELMPPALDTAGTPAQAIFLYDLKERIEGEQGWLAKSGAFDDEHVRRYGKHIQVGGVVSPKGLMIHPPENGVIRAFYDVPSGCDQFVARVAINDGVYTVHPPESPITFSVRDDAGRQLWSTPPFTGPQGTVYDCRVDLSGVKTISLVVGAAGSNRWAHAVWMEPRFVPATREPRPANANHIRLLARLTGESLGTTDSNTDRRLALNRRFLASHKDGGNGSVTIWPLDDSFSLGPPRELVSPHRTHDAATFGGSLFIDDRVLGVGSSNTWVSAPHDGRFYLFDIQSGSHVEDFNPGPHAAQYFGHSAECSGQGFFVVAEDGNTGHGSKAGFTFYKRPAIGQRSSPLLRDVIGANSGGYAVTWSTVGAGGLVAAAPYRQAKDAGWTLQSWRAIKRADGEVTSVARAAQATGFPIIEGEQTRACSQCKTNGSRVALSQPSSKGGRVLLFDCSTPDELTYLGSLDAPEDAGRDFAYSIAFAGHVLCIGAPNATTQQGGKGAVYLLDTRRFPEKQRMRRIAMDATASSERFGMEIAIGDGLMAVSAGRDVVYLFSLPKPMADVALDERTGRSHSPHDLVRGR